MGLEILTRGARKVYEQYFFDTTQKQLHEFLFPIPDEDLSSSFLIDRFIQNPHGVVYRESDSQSVIRKHEAGVGSLYEAPHCSEKTPIPESLRDVVATGLEATAPITEHTAKTMMQIVQSHVTGHTITKNKQAIDVIRTGNFYANGIDGKDLNVGFDFGRAAGNSTTYDFTAGGATMAKAIKAMVDIIHITNKGGLSGIAIILGSDWLNQFSIDAGVLAYLQANTANMLLLQNMMPPELQGVQGLYLLAIYRAPNMLAPVYILSYDPGVPYIAYDGASVGDWIPATSAIAFTLNSPRYTVLRGMSVIGTNGATERLSGQLVFDTFNSKDPTIDYIRSNTRHVFIPANINHTVESVGTF